MVYSCSDTVAAAGSWCTGIKIEALQPGMYTQYTQHTIHMHLFAAFVYRSAQLSFFYTTSSGRFEGEEL